MFEPVLAFQADTWASKASMNHARAYLGVAGVNGKIYAIGGDEGSETGNCMTGTSMTSNVVNYTEEYDPSSNVWTEKAEMPTSRALFGTAVFQDKIYCIGGYNAENLPVGTEDWGWKTQYYTLPVNEVYNPASNTWQSLAAMPTPRYSAATNVLDGVIYVMGGHAMTDLTVAYNVTEAYNIQTNTWTTKTPSPLPISSSSSAIVDDKIYVLGELQAPDSGFVLMVYDPAFDSWTVEAKTPVGYTATAVATTGLNAPKRVFFFDENRTDIYNPSTGNWSTGTPAPTDRLIAKAVLLDDTIYLIGGRTGQWGYITFMYPSTLNEQYTPIGYGQPDEPAPNTTSMPTTNPAPSSPENSSPTDKQNPTETASDSSLTVPVVAFSIAAIACVGFSNTCHKS